MIEHRTVAPASPIHQTASLITSAAETLLPSPTITSSSSNPTPMNPAVLQRCLLLALLAAAAVSCCRAQQFEFRDVCPPDNGIPASSNVTDLTELTFWGKVADGRVWFVEFYADWCRGCRRIAGHVSMLADSLAETHPEIVVARVNCGAEEDFCAHGIKISRTPSFTVYYQGKKAMDYNVEFFFADSAQLFITDIAANLQGFSLPSSKPQQQQPDDDGEEDEYDEYN